MAGRVMDARLEVPIEVRELALAGIDNAEKALVLFFDHATKSIGPNSADAVALVKRVIAVKMDYARKVARSSDLSEATSLQFAYCKAQVEITTDLIRIVSEYSDRASGPVGAWRFLNESATAAAIFPPKKPY